MEVIDPGEVHAVVADDGERRTGAAAAETSAAVDECDSLPH